MSNELTRSLVFVCFFAARCSARALQNITLPLPVGTTNHNTPGLICTPSQWTDIASFYLFNYIAHAATVLTRPGERSRDFAATVFGSLLLPAMGLYRGMEAIFSGAAFCKDDVRKAAKSAALCCVVRSSTWRPEAGQRVGNALISRVNVMEQDESEIEGDTSSETEPFQLVVYRPPWLLLQFGCPMYVHRQIVHGHCSLPEGYTLAIVPSNARFSPNLGENTHGEIASNYNFIRALVALIQTGYACLTLYQSRGDQIKQFGFSAFGLTVAPYAVMSVVNLIGNLCRPDYPCVYMVESSIMDEARSRGGKFHGTVATVEEELESCVSADTNLNIDAIGEVEFPSLDNAGQPATSFTLPRVWHWHPPLIDEEKTSKSDSPLSLSPIHTNTTTIATLHPTSKPHTPKDRLLLVPACNPLKPLSPAPTPYTLKSTTHHIIPFCKTRILLTKFHLPPSYSRTHILKYTLTLLISLFPLLINGLLSHFHSGTIANANITWKMYTMQWLAFGVVTGLWLVWDQENKDGSDRVMKYGGGWKARAVLYLVSASPAVGGFVVVGQMMGGFGECRWVGG